MLTANEIRSRYLDFFGKRMHAKVPSGPLIPPDDPSLLFTNAGMVQFKQYFLGDPGKPFSRATSCQKCLRVSGKHNDLENVGRTARHHTFFEMLGNFSFGDYFKREAITWAWEFVTRELGLPPEKLWVTVYRDDDEAASIWAEVAGLPQERIVRMGEKDNFWSMGDTGPCGPCSEIYIDQGEEMACGPDCGIGKCDCDRFLEIWNLVFTQFDQAADGSRSPLAAPNIDTGMGLERIAAVCQGKRSNFDCDLFQEIIQHAASLAGVRYSESAPDTNDIDTALRVIADHSRAAAFLISEGVLPSNENRGYVLRRLIRRALRFATLMGVHEPFMHRVSRKVTEVMGEAYPELAQNADFIERVVLEEEKRFAQTLDNGLHLLEEELNRLDQLGAKKIPGEFCFRLYDTYGFPLDIINDVAEKRGFEVDTAAFEEEMGKQRARARGAQKKGGILARGKSDEIVQICRRLAGEGVRSKFTGYASLSGKGRVLALLDHDGERVISLGEGANGFLVATQTPFYGESGGQIGDTGEIRGLGGTARVSGALKPVPDIILHQISVTSGELYQDQEIELMVNGNERKDIARNHTCTHLLQAALRNVLGEHVKQAGSLVTAQRLRFDFSHFSQVAPEQLAEIERRVNAAIMADLPVAACEMSRDEAIGRGAMALFGEKYGDRVRVLTIGTEAEPASMELCGGTHLERTGEAGSFYIVSESGVSAGTRRIEAVTGWQAYSMAIGQRAELAALAAQLKSAPGQLADKIAGLQQDLRQARKAIEKEGAARGMLDAQAESLNGVQFLAQDLGSISQKAMRGIMDDLRSKHDHGAVICLTGEENGKVFLLLHVSKNLQDRFLAPEIIRELSPLIGGSGGGGRPDLAQAGGDNAAGIPAVFSRLKEIIA
ncbi:MAG: alanine--tRNA ligase [Desulfovibrio sp.]|nr:alanine--tRNA ligase [Desulfovibrio sp.]